MHGKRSKSRVVSMALGLAVVAGPLLAAGPSVKVQLQGSYQSSDSAEAKWANLEEGTKVSPGDRILYRVEVSNQGDMAAKNPVAIGPIPAGTKYVAGTATQEASLQVDYSIDGGKTYSSVPTISVTGKDGKVQTLPAPVERYTTVRWSWNSVLPPGAKSSVSYQVQVR
jgi:uncharacterized repeat protein (TIGR01451 family)